MRDAAKAPSSKTSTATAFSISMPASPSWPPATAHPRVVEAIQQQAARLIHMSGTDFYYEEWWPSPKNWPTIAPGGWPARVSFGNSGAEAVEGAIKLARYATGRDKFIAFFGAFPRPHHGRALAHRQQSGAAGAASVRCCPGCSTCLMPYCYRCAYGKQPDTCAVECVQVHREHAVQDHSCPPRKSRPSLWSPCRAKAATSCRRGNSPTNWRALRDKHGILLIHDEVQSGMGRTGKMWASRAFRSRARHRDRRQRDRQRHAARRHRRPRRTHELAARGARLHLRRQPGRHRGGARPPSNCSKRSLLENAAAWAHIMLARMRALARALSRTSAMCAAWAS